jgi:hypothetical protein
MPNIYSELAEIALRICEDFDLPVHALLCLASLELLLFVRKVIIQDGPEFFEVVEWNGESTRAANLVYMDDDNTTGSWNTFDGMCCNI